MTEVTSAQPQQSSRTKAPEQSARVLAEKAAKEIKGKTKEIRKKEAGTPHNNWREGIKKTLLSPVERVLGARGLRRTEAARYITWYQGRYGRVPDVAEIKSGLTDNTKKDHSDYIKHLQSQSRDQNIAERKAAWRAAVKSERSQRFAAVKVLDAVKNTPASGEIQKIIKGVTKSKRLDADTQAKIREIANRPELAQALNDAGVSSESFAQGIESLAGNVNRELNITRQAVKKVGDEIQKAVEGTLGEKVSKVKAGTLDRLTKSLQKVAEKHPWLTQRIPGIVGAVGTAGTVLYLGAHVLFPGLVIADGIILAVGGLSLVGGAMSIASTPFMLAGVAGRAAGYVAQAEMATRKNQTFDRTGFHPIEKEKARKIQRRALTHAHSTTEDFYDRYNRYFDENGSLRKTYADDQAENLRGKNIEYANEDVLEELTAINANFQAGQKFETDGKTAWQFDHSGDFVTAEQNFETDGARVQAALGTLNVDQSRINQAISARETVLKSQLAYDNLVAKQIMRRRLFVKAVPKVASVLGAFGISGAFFNSVGRAIDTFHHTGNISDAAANLSFTKIGDLSQHYNILARGKGLVSRAVADIAPTSGDNTPFIGYAGLTNGAENSSIGASSGGNSFDINGHHYDFNNLPAGSVKELSGGAHPRFEFVDPLTDKPVAFGTVGEHDTITITDANGDPIPGISPIIPGESHSGGFDPSKVHWDTGPRIDSPDTSNHDWQHGFTKPVWVDSQGNLDANLKDPNGHWAIELRGEIDDPSQAPSYDGDPNHILVGLQGKDGVMYVESGTRIDPSAHVPITLYDIHHNVIGHTFSDVLAKYEGVTQQKIDAFEAENQALKDWMKGGYTDANGARGASTLDSQDRDFTNTQYHGDFVDAVKDGKVSVNGQVLHYDQLTSQPLFADKLLFTYQVPAGQDAHVFASMQYFTGNHDTSSLTTSTYDLKGIIDKLGISGSSPNGVPSGDAFLNIHNGNSVNYSYVDTNGISHNGTLNLHGTPGEFKITDINKDSGIIDVIDKNGKHFQIVIEDVNGTPKFFVTENNGFMELPTTNGNVDPSKLQAILDNNIFSGLPNRGIVPGQWVSPELKITIPGINADLGLNEGLKGLTFGVISGVLIDIIPEKLGKQDKWYVKYVAQPGSIALGGFIGGGIPGAAAALLVSYAFKIFRHGTLEQAVVSGGGAIVGGISSRFGGDNPPDEPGEGTTSRDGSRPDGGEPPAGGVASAISTARPSAPSTTQQKSMRSALSILGKDGKDDQLFKDIAQESGINLARGAKAQDALAKQLAAEGIGKAELEKKLKELKGKSAQEIAGALKDFRLTRLVDQAIPVSDAAQIADQLHIEVPNGTDARDAVIERLKHEDIGPAELNEAYKDWQETNTQTRGPVRNMFAALIGFKHLAKGINMEDVYREYTGSAPVADQTKYQLQRALVNELKEKYHLMPDDIDSRVKIITEPGAREEAKKARELARSLQQLAIVARLDRAPDGVINGLAAVYNASGDNKKEHIAKVAAETDGLTADEMDAIIGRLGQDPSQADVNNQLKIPRLKAAIRALRLNDVQRDKLTKDLGVTKAGPHATLEEAAKALDERGYTLSDIHAATPIAERYAAQANRSITVADLMKALKIPAIRSELAKIEMDSPQVGKLADKLNADKVADDDAATLGNIAEKVASTLNLSAAEVAANLREMPKEATAERVFQALRQPSYRLAFERHITDDAVATELAKQFGAPADANNRRQTFANIAKAIGEQGGIDPNVLNTKIDNVMSGLPEGLSAEEIASRVVKAFQTERLNGIINRIPDENIINLSNLLGKPANNDHTVARTNVVQALAGIDPQLLWNGIMQNGGTSDPDRLNDIIKPLLIDRELHSKLTQGIITELETKNGVPSGRLADWLNARGITAAFVDELIGTVQQQNQGQPLSADNINQLLPVMLRVSTLHLANLPYPQLVALADELGEKRPSNDPTILISQIADKAEDKYTPEQMYQAATKLGTTRTAAEYTAKLNEVGDSPTPVTLPDTIQPYETDAAPAVPDLPQAQVESEPEPITEEQEPEIEQEPGADTEGSSEDLSTIQSAASTTQAATPAQTSSGLPPVPPPFTPTRVPSLLPARPLPGESTDQTVAASLPDDQDAEEESPPAPAPATIATGKRRHKTNSSAAVRQGGSQPAGGAQVTRPRF